MSLIIEVPSPWFMISFFVVFNFGFSLITDLSREFFHYKCINVVFFTDFQIDKLV